mmetsp:Transcript_79651/g.151261  ORF Transcript_79651/g.151261 Transcript_79651/m.151261 type:complete len:104 (-) Transcript_79651:29-340(-)
MTHSFTQICFCRRLHLAKDCGTNFFRCKNYLRTVASQNLYVRSAVLVDDAEREMILVHLHVVVFKAPANESLDVIHCALWQTAAHVVSSFPYETLLSRDEAHD